MLRLTKLEIRKFDGIEPTTLTFGPGFNVLLGKNASGKTTLLDIIAAILADDLQLASQRSEEIALSFDLRQGEKSLGIDIEATAPAPVSYTMDAEFPLDMSLKDTVRAVRVQVRLDDGRVLEFSTRGAGIAHADGQNLEDGLPAAFIWRPRLLMALTAFATTSERLHVLRLKVNRWGRFDEAHTLWYRWFAAISAERDLEFGWHPRGKSSFPGRDVPASFAAAYHETFPFDATPPTSLLLPTAELPPLMEAVDLFGLSAAHAESRLRASAPTAAEHWSAEYSGVQLSFEGRDGSVFPADWLSFGQKRMLAFLLYEYETRGTPAVLDELVNGLHYDWVELCMDKLRDRQSFLAAQNPLILDLLGFASAEEVRSTFIQCVRIPGEKGRDRMKWTNFTEEQAKRFYDAYAVGIQHVQEILKDEQLW